jgi:hypothetical protein
MASILGARAPAMMAISRRPIGQGWMPTPTRHHHRPGGVLLCDVNCLGFLLIVTLIFACFLVYDFYSFRRGGHVAANRRVAGIAPCLG